MAWRFRYSSGIDIHIVTGITLYATSTEIIDTSLIDTLSTQTFTNILRQEQSLYWRPSNIEANLKELGDKAPKRGLILAAASLSFDSLNAMIVDLGIEQQKLQIELNRYHQLYDKTVINVTCELPESTELHSLLSEVSQKYFMDIFVQTDISIESKGLVVFDMDSTLIEMECIDEIAGLAGVGEQVAAVTEKAMRGEIEFSESLHHRVKCLEGVSLDALLNIRQRLPFMPGLTLLIHELKRQGWKTAIASGGFTYFADHIKRQFDFDYAFSNTLEVVGDCLTGKVSGEIVDAQAKADILEKLAISNDIALTNTIAVGDGANDLVMMAKAGAGIAFRAKPKVEAQAANAIRFSGLEGVLYLLG